MHTQLCTHTCKITWKNVLDASFTFKRRGELSNVSMWAYRHKWKVTHTLFKTLPINLFLCCNQALITKAWCRVVRKWNDSGERNFNFWCKFVTSRPWQCECVRRIGHTSLQLPLQTINDQTEQKLHSQSCDNPAPQPLQACGFDKAGWVPSGRKGDWNCMGGRARGRAKKKGHTVI